MKNKPYTIEITGESLSLTFYKRYLLVNRGWKESECKISYAAVLKILDIRPTSYSNARRLDFPLENFRAYKTKSGIIHIGCKTLSKEVIADIRAHIPQPKQKVLILSRAGLHLTFQPKHLFVQRMGSSERVPVRFPNLNMYIPYGTVRRILNTKSYSILRGNGLVYQAQKSGESIFIGCKELTPKTQAKILSLIPYSK